MCGETCKTSPDDFCYICGRYNPSKFKKKITRLHKRAYLSYFGIKIRNQDKQWVPHFVCNSCHATLLKWMSDVPGTEFKFEYPMRWRQPNGADCYFCSTNVAGATEASTDNVVYANVASATKPVMQTGNAFDGIWPPASMPKETECNSSTCSESSVDFSIGSVTSGSSFESTEYNSSTYSESVVDLSIGTVGSSFESDDVSKQQ